MIWLIILLIIILVSVLFYFYYRKDSSSLPLTSLSDVNPSSPPSELVILLKERLKKQLDLELRFGPYCGIRYVDLLYEQLTPVAECMAKIITEAKLNPCQSQGLEWGCGFGKVLCNAKKLGRFLSAYGMAPEGDDSCPEGVCKRKKCCPYRRLGRTCTSC